jgi:hypothetical protein
MANQHHRPNSTGRTAKLDSRSARRWFDTTVYLQFRAEAFNFANHVNLGLVNGSFSPGPTGYNQSATFGTITSARDARTLQFGLKLVY